MDVVERRKMSVEGADVAGSKIPDDLQRYLQAEDGAKDLVLELPKRFTFEKISTDSKELEIWARIGVNYLEERRFLEATSILFALYEHMLSAQVELKRQVHKGTPLVLIAECFTNCGFAVLSKRYVMLALCEDAIRDSGTINAGYSGVYFRLLRRFGMLGMNDGLVRKFVADAWRLAEAAPKEAKFPEWILQRLDQDWITEFPVPAEANHYVINSSYLQSMMSELGNSKGSALEQLAEYLMQCMPGCRTARRKRTLSTDYDVICSMEGFDVDFRSELGRYFVCECKDWKKAATYTSLAKFCRVLDSVKAKFGILFSKKGISGVSSTSAAAREQLKIFQDRGMVIVVVDEGDLESVVGGRNFVTILRQKYEAVRLDLYVPKPRTKRRAPTDAPKAG